jgi:hypothetical protein
MQPDPTSAKPSSVINIAMSFIFIISRSPLGWYNANLI